MSQRYYGVPQENIHPVIREGNTAPEVETLFEEAKRREPPPSYGQRIALGLTLLREVDAKVALRWFDLLRRHWWPGPVYNGRGQYTVQARNLVLHQALQELSEWDRLLFWDADQVPPLWMPALPDIKWQGGFFTEYLQFLSATQTEKKVIGGLYFSREDYWQTDLFGKIKAGPHEPVAYWGNAEDGTYRYLTLQELAPMLQRRGFHRVKGAGTGCMLIDKAALLELAEVKAPKPIFEAPQLQPGQAGGGTGTQWTEDLYFCHEMETKLGNWIWLDSAMEVVHVAEIWITSAHYLESRGISTAPHPASFRAQQETPNRDNENERRKSRIILPR